MWWWKSGVEEDEVVYEAVAEDEVGEEEGRWG